MDKKNLLVLLFLMFLINPAKAFSPNCDKLVDIFKDNHTGVKLYQVDDIMDKCLVEAQEYKYQAKEKLNTESKEDVSKLEYIKSVCANKKPRNFVIEGLFNFDPIRIVETDSTKDLSKDIHNKDLTLYDADPNNLVVEGQFFNNIGFNVTPKIDSFVGIYNTKKLEFCQYVSQINYEFNIQDRKVYLSNDIPRSSCEYYFILRHELIHASIVYKTILDYAEFLEDEIKKAFLEHNFYYHIFASKDGDYQSQVFSASKLLNEEISNKIINDIFMALRNEILDEINAQNEQFDYEEFKYRDKRLDYFCSY